MARQRGGGGVGGGQGPGGFFARLKSFFRRRPAPREGRRTCCQTEYRCELVDDATGDVIASDYSVVRARCGAHQLQTANMARRQALAKDQFANRRGGGYTTFEEARRRYPRIRMRCVRTQGPYEVPGPC